MNLGNLVGHRSLRPSQSNIWDMSHYDKTSPTFKNWVGAQAMPSPALSPRVEAGAQISCFRLLRQLTQVKRQSLGASAARWSRNRTIRSYLC